LIDKAKICTGCNLHQDRDPSSHLHTPIIAGVMTQLQEDRNYTSEEIYFILKIISSWYSLWTQVDNPQPGVDTVNHSTQLQPVIFIIGDRAYYLPI
jgi:hypothetical protein